jgi:hypothetical protein
LRRGTWRYDRINVKGVRKFADKLSLTNVNTCQARCQQANTFSYVRLPEVEHLFRSQLESIDVPRQEILNTN